MRGVSILGGYWGSGVTDPNSMKLNPRSKRPSTATPSVSIPAASPMGLENVRPLFVFTSWRVLESNVTYYDGS